MAIAERNTQDVFEALKTIISDTTKMTTQYGCIVEETTLSDLCINTVREIYHNNYEGYTPNHYQLNEEEKAALDKLVLNLNLDLNYKN